MVLRDVEPAVTRTIDVPASATMPELHELLQAAMRWTNSHLHLFIHPTGHYGTPDPELPLHDERKATLRDLAGRVGDAFGYEYDLGDSWEHEVLLEKLVPAEPGGRYPACLDGERACPPEDCGGTSGYKQLIDTLADPNHPDHHDMLQWLGIQKGTDFDPAHFDPADADRRLDTVVHAATRTG